MKGEIDGRLKALKDRLVFGEAASACGLKGASREGWTCPACGTEHGLKERSDHQGARCAMEDCRQGFDTVRIVMVARNESFIGAVRILEKLADEKDAAAATGAGDLFGGTP